MDVITTLKSITRLSTSKMLNIIKAGCPYDLCAGKAAEVKQLKSNLESVNIKFSIKTYFQW